MAQQTVAARHEVEEISLEEVLEDVGMTEEEFRAMVEEGIREFKEGKTTSFKQLKRECGLA